MQKKIFLLTLAIVTTVSCFADPGDPPCDDMEGGPDSCPVPLDTWVYLLVFAFVIFGAYKMYQKQKELSV